MEGKQEEIKGQLTSIQKDPHYQEWDRENSIRFGSGQLPPGYAEKEAEMRRKIYGGDPTDPQIAAKIKTYQKGLMQGRQAFGSFPEDVRGSLVEILRSKNPKAIAKVMAIILKRVDTAVLPEKLAFSKRFVEFYKEQTGEEAPEAAQRVIEEAEKRMKAAGQDSPLETPQRQ